MKFLLASLCVVSLLCFSGCGPVPSTPSVDRPTIYAFSAPWCSACVRDKARVNQLERAGYTVVRINIMSRPDLRKRHQIHAVPLYLIISRGRVVLRTHNLNLVIQTLRR